MEVLFLYQGNTSDPSFRACKLPLFKELKDVNFKIVVLEDDLGLDLENVEIVLEQDSFLPKYIFDILSKTSKFEFDLVHTLKPGTSFPSYIISRMRDKPLVVDADDYDWTGNFIYKKVGDCLTKESKHEALITASKKLTSLFDGEYLPFTVDLKKFDGEKHEEDRKSLRKKYNLEGFQVLLWGGIFHPQVNIDFLAELGNELKENQKLLVVGEGDKFSEFKRKTSGLGEEKVVTPGWIDREEIPKYYSAGDIGIFPFPDTLYHQCKCPIKLFEYMSTSLPIFTTPVGEPKHMVEKTGCGEICETPKELASKASGHEKKELEKMGLKGREFLEKNQNIETQATKLKNVYEKALERKK